MEASELRIGNYFYGDTSIGVVERIKPTDIIMLYDDPLDDYYKPIQLTEEWLMKFSFKTPKLNIGTNKIRYIGNFVIQSSRSNFVWEYSINDFETLRIKYVHQLQNLYFALTGKELKYEK